MPSFQPLKNVFESELATAGAPMLRSGPSADKKCDKRYFFNVAYVPICPFQEFCYSNPFSFTENSVKLFIVYILSTLMLKDRKGEVDLIDVKFLWEFIVNFATKSTTITKPFSRKG